MTRNTIKVAPPAPMGVTTYTYDSLSRITSITDGLLVIALALLWVVPWLSALDGVAGFTFIAALYRLKAARQGSDDGRTAPRPMDGPANGHGGAG